MINEKRFFKLCKEYGNTQIAYRIGINSTTLCNWVKANRVPPLRWSLVNNFLMEMENGNVSIQKKKKKRNSGSKANK